MRTLALCARAAVLAEQDHRRESLHGQSYDPLTTLVLRVMPRQSSPVQVWLFTGDETSVWFRGAFGVSG